MNNIVPTDSPSIYRELDSLTTLEKNAIVRPNNPPFGIAGFVFDINSEDAIDLQADITDNYVEDNTAIQDQIALKPEVVTVRGLVGELAQTEQQVDVIAKELAALPANEDLAPEYTDIQIKEFGKEKQVEEKQIEAKTDTQSLDAYFTARTPITNSKQKKAFNYFYQLWKGRQLFTVDTPWGFFTDMTIQNLRVSQDESSELFSSFTISFKKMRFAQEVTISRGQLAGRCAQQSAEKTNNGVAGKEPVTTEKNQSWLFQLTK
jgi:hypothetical protein